MLSVVGSSLCTSQTPALLQLSGVGDPALLEPLGIKTLVNITTVGKNLQEQTMNSLGAGGNGFNPGGRGPSDTIAYPNLYQLFGQEQADAWVKRIVNSVATWAQAGAKFAYSADALELIYKIQSSFIITTKGTISCADLRDLADDHCLIAPVVELFYDTGYPECVSRWSSDRADTDVFS